MLVVGCKRNPVDRLANPVPSGALPGSSGIFVIYADELRTGGGAGFIPGGENQSLAFDDRSEPRHDNRAIRYEWNGGDVFDPSTGTVQHLFAGFVLPVTSSLADLDTATGKDLTATTTYMRLQFFARGALSTATKLRIEGPDDGSGGITPARMELDSSQLTSNWQEFTLNVPPGDFSDVKVFLTISFQYEQPPRTESAGNGGVVYLDDIRYVQ